MPPRTRRRTPVCEVAASEARGEEAKSRGAGAEVAQAEGREEHALPHRVSLPGHPRKLPRHCAQDGGERRRRELVRGHDEGEKVVGVAAVLWRKVEYLHEDDPGALPPAPAVGRLQVDAVEGHGEVEVALLEGEVGIPEMPASVHGGVVQVVHLVHVVVHVV